MKDNILEYCSVDNNEEDLFIGEQFDSCLLGVCSSSAGFFTSAYSLDSILDILINTKNMTEDEAIRYFNVEILDKKPNIFFIKRSNESPEILSNYNNEMLFLDDYQDNHIFGVAFAKDSKIVAVYNDNDCINRLIDSGMSEEEAIEYFEYNTRGSYVGENTPIFITLF